MNYGKSSVQVAGGEAAPYEVFVGNTHPDSTIELIKEVIEKCAAMLPEAENLTEPLTVLRHWSFSCNERTS